MSDTYNHTIRKITPDGAVSTLAGLAGSPGFDDGDGSAARFNFPNSLALDTSGNLFVGDTENQAIRRVTPSGKVSTWLEGLDLLSGGLAVDATGHLFIGENNQILMVNPSGNSQILAGDGGAGSADGTGSSARFDFLPGFSADAGGGLAIDRLGNVYVADTANSTIRKVTPAGIVTTLAGKPGEAGYADGQGQDALFNGPAAVAVDGAGNVYVTDSYNTAVRKIDSAGNVSTMAGSASAFGTQDGIGKAARFGAPEGVAVDSAGTVYVADTYNHTIRKITSTGTVTTWAGVARQPGSSDGIANAAGFNEPAGIAVDTLGNVYVADRANRIVRKITPPGEVTTLAGKASPPGLGFDPRTAYADGAGPDARFEYPQDVAVDSGGNVFVADSGNRAIRKITQDGFVTTIAGDPSIRDETGYVVGDYLDGPANHARFLDPTALAVDRTGAIFVIDTVLIRRIAGGQVTTLAGDVSNAGSKDGLGRQAQFNWPSGLAVDDSGNVFVGDAGNQVVRKLTPFGTNWVVTTVAGLAGSAGGNDGVGQAARFGTQGYSPMRIAVDHAGHVYVADAGNNAIRKGYPALVISAFGLSNGQVRLNVTGPPAQSLLVESSSDLVEWLPVWTNIFTGVDLQFSHPQSGDAKRFYRARTPQLAVSGKPNLARPGAPADPRNQDPARYHPLPL